jgi:hypothetical protein
MPLLLLGAGEALPLMLELAQLARDGLTPTAPLLTLMQARKNVGMLEQRHEGVPDDRIEPLRSHPPCGAGLAPPARERVGPRAGSIEVLVGSVLVGVPLAAPVEAPPKLAAGHQPSESVARRGGVVVSERQGRIALQLQLRCVEEFARDNRRSRPPDPLGLGTIAAAGFVA